MTFHLRIGLVYFFVTLIYLAGSDFFGLFEASQIIPGELYDYIFVSIVLFVLLYTRGKIIIQSSRLSLFPYMLLIILASGQMIVLYKTGQQGIFDSLGAIRELLYLFILYAFYQLNFNVEKVIRYIIILNVISVFVYALEMMVGGPLFGAGFHVQGLYQPIGGVSVWRCFSSIPFASFSLVYMFAKLLNNECLFGSNYKDKAVFAVLLLGILLKMGRTTIMATILVFVIAYYCATPNSLYGKIIKGIKILAVLMAGLVLMYFFSNGVFMRLLEGIVAIFEITNLESDSTFMTRISTLYVRYNYLIDSGNLLLGLGPYNWKASLVVDAVDKYATNRGVFSPDSGYATFIVRYGIIGTGLYIYGHIKNFFILQKRRNTVCLATACYLLSSLIGGFGGYGAMGDMTLLNIGILFALCIKDEENSGRQYETA